MHTTGTSSHLQQAEVEQVHQLCRQLQHTRAVRGGGRGQAGGGGTQRAPQLRPVAVQAPAAVALVKQRAAHHPAAPNTPAVLCKSHSQRVGLAAGATVGEVPGSARHPSRALTRAPPGGSDEFDKSSQVERQCDGSSEYGWPLSRQNK